MKLRDLVAVLLLLPALLTGCKDKKQADFSPYISGFTSGVITSSSPITIYLTQTPDKGFQPGSTLPAGILRITPDIKGSTVLKDNNSIEFTPSEPFRNGTTYEADFQLGALLEVPGSHQNFHFSFRTVPLSVAFDSGELYTENDTDTELQYQGILLSSDHIDASDIEKKLEVSYQNRSLQPEWNHNGNKHYFSIRHLQKSAGSQPLKLRFSKDVKNGGEKEIVIPGQNTFSVLNVTASESEPVVISIYMSQNIAPEQDLKGLITLEGIPSLNFKIRGNIIYVYPSSNGESGLLNLTLHPGIKSTTGNSLQTEFVRSIQLESLKPEVNFIGKGVIVPTSDEVIVPFSAVALKAVDLEVIQVFGQNMNFFLQENTYDDRSELTRTARPVFMKKIDLAGHYPQLNLNKRNDFTINLSDVVKLDKGNLYRIRLKFKKSYTTLSCADEAPDSDYGTTDWDSDNSYYSEYYYPENYQWNERDNPCHISYYTGNRFSARNLITTNIGIMAKRGADNRYIVCVTSLPDAKPVINSRISLYNYQNQKIDSAYTDKNGFAELQPGEKAFIVLAEKDGDKAWLRMASGDALSLSNFDVSGQHVQMGVKGFIYGERGVWRPGDEIYLSLILEDKSGTLPDGHPILAQLIDPNGHIVQTLQRKTGSNNIHCFTFRTDENAQTGYWHAIFRIGGLTFKKTLRIETIKPNRLAIQVDFPHPKIIGEGISEAPVQVKTRWLNGARTSHQKAITEVRLYNSYSGFPEFPDYSFSDKSRYFEPTNETLFDGTTDGEGNFSFPITKIKTENAPGLLNATFTTRVFENGGDFSITSQTLHYSPYTQYVGIRLPAAEDNWYATRENIPLKGILVTPTGKSRGQGTVRIEVYKLSWQWWWDTADENLGSYVNREYSKSVWNKEVKAVDGAFSTDLQIHDYGRYFIRATAPSGHTAGLIAYFGSWGENSAQNATLLSLKTDKQKYRTGETIRLTLPSAKDGTAIITQENGKTIEEITRIRTQAGSTTVEFKATEKMCPNTYFSVMLIQPQAGRDNDRPIRLYGVVNVDVEDPDLHLHPVVRVAPELRPARDFTVQVSEEKGKTMNYTIAVVDEGLLSLTGFRTPDPFSVFYAREALGVKTWDFYDYIFGAYGARLDQAFAVGGDESLQNLQDEKTNRFKPVVLFSGPYTLKAGQSATHTFCMPEYIGEVRTMVIAATNGTYGSAAANSTVSKPLMLSVALPRLFTPGDIIDIPVTVFAMKDNIRKVKVSISADDKISFIGATTAQVNFGSTGEKVVFFKARINEKTGISTLKTQAVSGEETASVTEDVNIRIPNPRITRTEEKTAKAGESVSVEMKVTGAEPSSVLEVSSIPPLNIEQRLNDLLDYPHGCAEQITSQAFPQLSLSWLLNLTPDQQLDAEAHVREVINRLSNYQTAEGGFAYWPGEIYVSEWVTTYITAFLLDARQQGYTVPLQMLRQAIAYLKQAANSWNPTQPWSQLSQAYRLYVLASAEEPDLAAMNRLREIGPERPVSRWLLASAYTLCKQPDIARKMVRELSSEVTPYRETGGTFGSTTRDNALILQSMVILDMQQDAYRMLEKISRAMGSGEWYSTQETAFALHAAALFVRKYLGSQKGIDILVRTADGEQNIRTEKTIWQLPLPIRNHTASATVRNNGQGNLFVRQITSSAPLEVVKEKIMSGLSMTARYYDDAGQPLNLAELPQGTDVTIEVTVKNTGLTGTYYELALVCPIPSGFEIINDRLTGNANAWKEAENVDIRDDRFYVYFSLEQGRSKTFRFRCNAAFRGEYMLPAIQCSAMYDNSIQAVLPGGKVNIE